MTHWTKVVDLHGYLEVCGEYYSDADKELILLLGKRHPSSYTLVEQKLIDAWHARPLDDLTDGQLAFCVRCKHVVMWTKGTGTWKTYDDRYGREGLLPQIVGGGKHGVCDVCWLNS